MNIPVAKKTSMLKEFHKHLHEEDWCFMESSEKDKAVLEEFPVVSFEQTARNGILSRYTACYTSYDD